MTPEQFAENEYRDFVVYRELARVETIPSFKTILEELMEHERGDFEFWRELSEEKHFHIGKLNLLCYVFMRKVLGLTFTVRFLEGREKEAVAAYNAYLRTVGDERIKERVQSIVAHEKYHEGALIGSIEETRVRFMSSIVLGLNDGLIELTGALTGFAFALQSALLVALAGTITGVSASLSMAASAYQQARHEDGGKNPVAAAFFTGVSYLIVVVLLIAPFVLVPSTLAALGTMLMIVVLVIIIASFYSSVLLERKFGAQFVEMLVFSLGVAIVAFAIGLLLRAFIGVEV